MAEKLTLQEFADKSKELLSKNDEWKDRYRGYANMIDPEQRAEPEVFKKFRVKAPLYFYTTIGNETQNKPITFLRYMGQNVATISASENQVTVHISSALAAGNKQFAKAPALITTLDNFDWNSKKALNLESFLPNCPRKIIPIMNTPWKASFSQSSKRSLPKTRACAIFSMLNSAESAFNCLRR